MFFVRAFPELILVRLNIYFMRKNVTKELFIREILKCLNENKYTTHRDIFFI